MATYDTQAVAINIGDDLAIADNTVHVYDGQVALLGDAQSYAQGFEDGLAAFPPPDANAPVITFVSPTPGVAPGAAGGFSADPSVAKNEPIVIRIGDVDPGVQYVCVTIAYTNEDDELIEEVVYRRSNFRGKYIMGSTARMVGDDLELAIKREGGWLELIRGSSTGINFSADAIDEVGNVSAES